MQAGLREAAKIVKDMFDQEYESYRRLSLEPKTLDDVDLIIKEAELLLLTKVLGRIYIKARELC